MADLFLCDPHLKRTHEGYVIVDLMEEMKRIAQEKANSLGILNNSIREGEGNFAGFLGEVAAEHAIVGARSCNTFNHDLLLNHIRFEVKSKDRNVVPEWNHEVSIAAYNIKQDTDYYVFVSIYNYQQAYILGYITPKEYFEMAHFIPKGAHDSSNGWNVKADCYNLLHFRLCVFA
jgi:hypothetical protein